MASIKRKSNKDGTASWIAQVRRRGYPSMTRSFRTKLEAELWASNTESAAMGRTLARASRMLMCELIDQAVPCMHRVRPEAIDYWRLEIGAMKVVNVRAPLIALHRDRLLDAPCASGGYRKTHPRSAATTRHYLQQLHRIFAMQRAIGYSLTGDTSEQCLFLAQGVEKRAPGRRLRGRVSARRCSI